MTGRPECSSIVVPVVADSGGAFGGRAVADGGGDFSAGVDVRVAGHVNAGPHRLHIDVVRWAPRRVHLDPVVEYEDPRRPLDRVVAVDERVNHSLTQSRRRDLLPALRLKPADLVLRPKVKRQETLHRRA